MTKLDAYQSALTLYGRIFSSMKCRKDLYFLAAIKYDLVFLLYALIWKRESWVRNYTQKINSSVGSHFFPKNFSEWQFGNRFVSFKENDRNLWNIDKNYFKKDTIIKRHGEELAVLTYGLDLERAFTLEELMKEKKVGAVIDWKGDLKRSPSFKVINKTKIFFSISFFYFLFQNFITLLKVRRLLVQNCQANLTLYDFLRYFFYPAFVSARIRYYLEVLSKDKSIGWVIFSDIDNSWGNSFSFWSHFYGFRQISYSHGFPIYNQNRYFSPDVCYTYAAFHEKAIKEADANTQTFFYPPAWFKGASSNREMVKKERISRIAFITTMEINLEAPFPEEEKLMDYLDALSDFVCRKKVSMVIKSHKLLDWHQKYDDFAAKYPCVQHIKERWKEGDFRQVDLAILKSTETILALQLLSAGIPVITCAELMSKIWTEHFSIPYLQFTVKTKKELQELIERFLQDQEFYQKAQKEAESIFKGFLKSPE